MIKIAKMFLLLVALLCVLSLARCDYNCNANEQMPGCKAKCDDGTSDGWSTNLDISNTFQYPLAIVVRLQCILLCDVLFFCVLFSAVVKAYDGHTYTYACGGGLNCTDNTENPHVTAVSY